jgi:twitching motility protein PilT
VAQLDRLFEIAVQRKASDLHLTSGRPPLMRVHGKMQPVDAEHPPISAAQLERMLLEIAPDDSRREFEISNDADFAYEYGESARFRCNIFRDRTGAGGVFRQIPRDIISAEKLGLSKEILDLCYLSKGLVIVTGPTGSGKSTTLCAMIDYINRNRDEHIITIEDPVEFIHESKRCLVNQREVGAHTTSFKRALRAALREDPNVIVVGEMRDLETIAIAVEMAETGHLVFGTLHTTTAASTVDRIIDQFPHEQQAQIRAMLADSLKGVIAQTLLKKKDGTGRVAALEVLLVTTPVAANIREGKTHQIPLAMQTGRKVGMRELNSALVELVQKETVTAEEAYVKAVDKAGIIRDFERLGIPFRTPGADVEAPKPEPTVPAAPRIPAPMPAAAAAAPKLKSTAIGATMGACVVTHETRPRPRGRTSQSRRRPSIDAVAPAKPAPQPEPKTAWFK